MEKINENKVAFFLGAGVSRLIGCSGWKALAVNLVEACYRKKYVNFKKRESILEINDLKKIITICYEIIKANEQNTKSFMGEIQNSLKANPDLLKSCNLYQELAGISAVFITTNVDTHFDHAFIPKS